MIESGEMRTFPTQRRMRQDEMEIIV